MVLLAVSGARLVDPIDEWWFRWSTQTYDTTVVGAPPEATVHTPGEALIFFMGADWSQLGGSHTATPPSGFVPVTDFGDHGNQDWDWTSMQVAWGYQADTGPTGVVMGSLSGTRTGAPWALLITVAP